MSNLVQRLHEQYQRNPDKIVLVIQHAGQPDQPLSYRTFLEGAAAYAETYRQAGLHPGEVIVLILQHGRELVSAFWGAILLGAIPSIMPFLTEKLQPERYRADLAALIETSRPAAIVTYPEFRPEVQAALTPNSPVRAVLTCDIDLTGFQPHPSSFISHPSDITLLQHSSGTTGLQKGVALSHQAVLNQVENYSRALDFSAQDVVVSWLPLYHDMGLIAGFVMPILSGAQLVLMSPFDWVRAPYRLFQALSNYRGSLCWLPNFAYNFCAAKIRDRDLTGVDLSCVRAVINCSEPVRWESHQRFAERFASYGLHPEALATCYAMAENVFAVTQSRPGRLPAVDVIDLHTFQSERLARPAQEGQPTLNMLSNGPPIANTFVRVLDEHGRDLPDRHVGEIALRSDCMLTGYYNRPDADQQAFLDGWYLTGDFGYCLEGEYYISGRKKDLIIVGGKNIYPQDLETLAMEAPGVHPGRVAAFGVFNEENGTEDVVLVAEVNTEDAQEQEHIAQAIRDIVTRGSAIALRHISLVSPGWLIKTSSGKTARAANREKYLKQTA